MGRKKLLNCFPSQRRPQSAQSPGYRLYSAQRTAHQTMTSLCVRRTQPIPPAPTSFDAPEQIRARSMCLRKISTAPSSYRIGPTHLSNRKRYSMAGLNRQRMSTPRQAPSLDQGLALWYWLGLPAESYFSAYCTSLFPALEGLRLPLHFRPAHPVLYPRLLSYSAAYKGNWNFNSDLAYNISLLQGTRSTPECVSVPASHVS